MSADGMMDKIEAYTKLKLRAERIQDAIDALNKAEPDVEMIKILENLTNRRNAIQKERTRLWLEMVNTIMESE